jgi:glycine cleavage system transcriptional repressor
MANMSPSTQLNVRKFAVAVMSRDRVGIVRDVTATLTGVGANIERVSQTVVMNYFTLTLIVTFPEPMAPDQVRSLLRSAGGPDELEISVKTFAPAAEKEPAVSNADCFVLTVTGPDRTGIIGEIAAYLAGKGINILDLYAYKPEDSSFMLISQLAVPAHMNAAQIQIDIEALSRKTGLSATLQHENIFKATNEVSAPANFFD